MNPRPVLRARTHPTLAENFEFIVADHSNNELYQPLLVPLILLYPSTAIW
jgi:hypothetical protein